jgi:elongation of very long chain fatty acids protein 6
MERLSHPNCNTSISNEKGKFQFTAEDSIDYSKMLLTMVRDFEGDYFPSFEFEKSSVDIGRVLWFMLENRWIPLITGIVYLMGIFIVQEFMKKRKPLELKWPLFIWNLTIGLFSLIGFVRTAPDLLQFFGKPNGFYESACAINSSPRFAFWAIMFAFSKIPELGKKIIF